MEMFQFYQMQATTSASLRRTLTLNTDYSVLKNSRDSKTTNYLRNKVTHPKEIDSFVLHLP